MRERILLIDTDEEFMRLLAEGLAANVGSNGCDVLFATSEQAAVKSAQHDKPALIILIVGSPDIDALELFKNLKTAPTTAAIPILILTAEDSETQEVLFLDYGADDYVGGAASLNADSLLARCRSILRRSSWPSNGRKKPVRPSAFSLNPEQNEVTIGKKVFQLAPKEFQLIQHLARHEAPLTRQALFARFGRTAAASCQRRTRLSVRMCSYHSPARVPRPRA